MVQRRYTTRSSRGVAFLGAAILFLCSPSSGFATCLDGEINCNEEITINLQVISAYEGTAVLDGSFFASGGIAYTATEVNTLTLGATQTSTYTITGDIDGTVTGSGVGTYTTPETIDLSGGDGIKELTVVYMSGGEPHIPAPLQIYLDTTPPTKPYSISPLIGQEIITEGVLFQWSPSTDDGSGLNEYVLTVSNSPTMTDPITFTTSQTSLLIHENLIPEGNIYWTVTAIDNVGNSSISIPSFFKTLKGPSGNSSSILNLLSPTPQTPPETDGVPEGEQFLDQENTEILEHNQPDQELLLTFNEKDTPHDLDDSGIPRDVDQRVTYVFQGHKKPSVIEVIKKNNHIQVLINQLQEDRHLVVTTDILGNLENTEGSLVLPTYLFKTGADLEELQRHLSLLAKYFPDPTMRKHIMHVIHYLLPYWRGGAFIFGFLLCYDIETHLNRQKNFR